MNQHHQPSVHSHALIKRSLQNLAQKTCEEQVIRNLARPSPNLVKGSKSKKQFDFP